MFNAILLYYTFGLKTLIIFLIINVFVSLYLKSYINKFYYSKEKSSKENNFHLNFPSFIRNDKNPSFSRIYFGLISFAYIKCFLYLILPLSVYIRIKIAVGNKKPNEVVNDKAIYNKVLNIISSTSYFMTIIAGIISPNKIDDKDKFNSIFKKYLGPEFNYNDSFNNNYSTVICNHIGWIDILFLGYKEKGVYVAKDSVSKIPIIGTICRYYNCVFINRTGSKEEREESIKQIEKRQENINKNQTDTKLIMFPEGTGNNNTGVLEFKKGPFAKLYPVKIYIVLIRDCLKNKLEKSNNTSKYFCVVASATNTFIHMIISFCYLYHNNFNYIELPVFTPNEFLYKNYSNLGNSKSNIYAEVCRRVISEVGDLELRSENYISKLNYLSKIFGKIIKST